MPSEEIMELFRQGKLHSGRSGKIVKSKKQAKAILLSYLRKEGHNIRKKTKRKRSTHKRVRVQK